MLNRLSNRSFAPLAASFALAATGLALSAAPAIASSATSEEQEPWIKVDDSREGLLDLKVAERVYTKAGAPTITMIGAIHIADPRYYGHLSKTLEEFDVVLYEGVGPGGAGELTPDLTDEQRVRRTESRIRLLAMLLERQRIAAESAIEEDPEAEPWAGFPETIEAIGASLESERAQSWFDAAQNDGWGRPLIYALKENGAYAIRSLGADGKEGGRGVNRDLSFALQPPISDGELGITPGLQQRMAQTFGLAFQGDHMSHDHPNHINADLSVDEIQDLLDEKGGDGSMIFGMLDGSSGMASIAGTVLRLIEVIPGGRSYGKLMMMEMLANADDALSAGGPGMGDTGALMEVIIVDRNIAVMEDLQAVLDAGEHQNIGVIYGAGHMKDFHERLVEDLGYEMTSDDWNLAMRLNLRRAGINPATANMMRTQIRGQIKAMSEQAAEESSER